MMDLATTEYHKPPPQQHLQPQPPNKKVARRMQMTLQRTCTQMDIALWQILKLASAAPVLQLQQLAKSQSPLTRQLPANDLMGLM
jgi:hypothetical protein